MGKKENKNEIAARAALNSHLLPDETLLEFSRCRREGFILSQQYYIGLTENALILVPYKGGSAEERSFRLWLSTIRSIRWTTSLQRYLLINFFSDNLKLRVASVFALTERSWSKRAVSLGRQANQLVKDMKNQQKGLSDVQFSAVSSTGAIDARGVVTKERMVALSEEQTLQQVDDFQALGLNGTAFEVLDAALKRDPNLEYQPGIKKLYDQAGATKAAYQRAGLFLIIDAGILLLTGLLPAIFDSSDAVIGFLFGAFAMLAADLWIGGNLVRGRSERRKLALYYATLLVIFTAISLLEDSSMGRSTGGFYPLAILALAISVFLPLTGKDKERRTKIATIIFVVGYLGITILDWAVTLLA